MRHHGRRRRLLKGDGQPNHSAVSGAPAAAVLERDGKCRHSTARSRLLPGGGRRAAQGEDSEAEGQALHGAGGVARRGIACLPRRSCCAVPAPAHGRTLSPEQQVPRGRDEQEAAPEPRAEAAAQLPDGHRRSMAIRDGLSGGAAQAVGVECRGERPRRLRCDSGASAPGTTAPCLWSGACVPGQESCLRGTIVVKTMKSQIFLPCSRVPV